MTSVALNEQETKDLLEWVDKLGCRTSKKRAARCGKEICAELDDVTWLFTLLHDRSFFNAVFSVRAQGTFVRGAAR